MMKTEDRSVDPKEAHEAFLKQINRDHDPVHSPSHYTSGGIETIDYIRAKMTPEQFEGYLVGNIMKYVSRYPLKNGVEDLKKAQWYLNRLIEAKEKTTSGG